MQGGPDVGKRLGRGRHPSRDLGRDRRHHPAVRRDHRLGERWLVDRPPVGERGVGDRELQRTDRQVLALADRELGRRASVVQVAVHACLGRVLAEPLGLGRVGDLRVAVLRPAAVGVLQLRPDRLRAVAPDDRAAGLSRQVDACPAAEAHGPSHLHEVLVGRGIGAAAIAEPAVGEPGVVGELVEDDVAGDHQCLVQRDRPGR